MISTSLIIDLIQLVYLLDQEVTIATSHLSIYLLCEASPITVYPEQTESHMMNNKFYDHLQKKLTGPHQHRNLNQKPNLSNQVLGTLSGGHKSPGLVLNSVCVGICCVSELL